MIQTRCIDAVGMPAAGTGRSLLASAFLDAVQRHGSAVALREKQLGLWHEITWVEYQSRAQAAHFRLHKAGIRPGNAVVIAARPSVEWLAAFMGATLAGAVPVILDESVIPGDVAGALAGLHPSAVLTDAEPLARAIAAAIPCVTILMMGEHSVLGSVSAAAGPTISESADAAMASRKPGDVALVAFTAGTTRVPRPLRFTHANLRHAMEHGSNPMEAAGERLAFASLARVHNLMFHVLSPFHHGGVTNFAESPQTVANDLREIAPTVLAGSPRFWCNLRNAVERHRDNAVRPGQILLDRAMGGPRPSYVGRALLSRVRQRFGLHRLGLAVVQGPLPVGTMRCFARLGIKLSSRYTVAELGGILLDGADRSPGHELRLGERDEILIRSPALATGCVDRDGWFHSGDAGLTDGNGRIAVLGRLDDRRGNLPHRADAVERRIVQSEYVVDCVVSQTAVTLTAVIAIDEHARLAARLRGLVGSREEDAIIEVLDDDLGRITGEPGWLRRQGALTIVHVDAKRDDIHFTPCSRLRRVQAIEPACDDPISGRLIGRDAHVQ